MHEVIYRRDAENSENSDKEEARSRQEGGEKEARKGQIPLRTSANLCVLCASAVKVFSAGLSSHDQKAKSASSPMNPCRRRYELCSVANEIRVCLRALAVAFTGSWLRLFRVFGRFGASSKAPTIGATEQGPQAKRTVADAACDGRAQTFLTAIESMTQLAAQDRNSLPALEFAFPAERKEPLPKASDIRNALARFKQVTGVSAAERDTAWRRILSSAKKYGVDVHDTSWRELGRSG
jgi:hypothetical protein